MNDQFDELAKNMAQSVTRRGALKKFGVGLAGFALAALGLLNNAYAAGGRGCRCRKPDYGCGHHFNPGTPEYFYCMDYYGVCCAGGCNL